MARYYFVSKIDPNLEMSGEMSRLKKTLDQAIYQSGTSRTSAVYPYFFKAFYRYHPVRDQVFYIQNNSNKIVVIDSAGNEQINGYLPYDHFPPDPEEIESILAGSTYYFTEMRAIVESKLLPHEPYYRNVELVGDRLWVQLARSDPEQPNWVITSLEGDVLESFHGPTDISSLTIRGNRMYGSFQDSIDTPYLVGYELVE
ncbi:MAG: hypothetical protein WDZ29_07205 [Balneolaceae bacterium]